MNTRFLFTRIVLSAMLILLLGAGIGYAQQPGNLKHLPPRWDWRAPPSPTRASSKNLEFLSRGLRFPIHASRRSFRRIADWLYAAQARRERQRRPVQCDARHWRRRLQWRRRWLGIQVKCPPDADYTDLGRRS